MVAHTALVRATRVVMLDTIGVESGNFAIVAKDGEFHSDFTFRSEKKFLETFWVF
jgi:hypothetical protein